MSSFNTIPIIGTKNYIIQAGDTLYQIARKFNTTIEIIRKFNDIPNPDLIFSEQVLVIPNSPPERILYTVKEGENLFSIALKFKTHIENILDFNYIIYPGQQLTITKGVNCYTKYEVRPGDFIKKIAKEFNTEVDTILYNNNIQNPDILAEGQILIINGTPSEPFSYTVKQRDNLFSIAMMFNTYIDCILDDNNLIYPGMKLIIIQDLK